MSCRFRVLGSQKREPKYIKREPRSLGRARVVPLVPFCRPPNGGYGKGNQRGTFSLAGDLPRRAASGSLGSQKKGTKKDRKVALGAERRHEILELRNQLLERFRKSPMAREMLRAAATNNLTK